MSASGCQRQLKIGRVEGGRGTITHEVIRPFPTPAHQTGRAELPHPAFRQASARAHAGYRWARRNGQTPNSPKTYASGN